MIGDPDLRIIMIVLSTKDGRSSETTAVRGRSGGGGA